MNLCHHQLVVQHTSFLPYIHICWQYSCPVKGTIVVLYRVQDPFSSQCSKLPTTTYCSAPRSSTIHLNFITEESMQKARREPRACHHHNLSISSELERPLSSMNAMAATSPKSQGKLQVISASGSSFLTMTLISASADGYHFDT